MQGETVSADTAAAEELSSLSRNIFNCDETGLYWRLLPNKTLADGTKKQAKNCKTSKDGLTLMATANATGDFRLPLVFIHKSKKPRCFAGVNMSALPVHYYCQKSAWMDRGIFSDWFHKHFVPLVKKYLADKSLSPLHFLFWTMLLLILLLQLLRLKMGTSLAYFYHQM